MPQNSVIDEARGLPREPTARWIIWCVACSAALWLGVFVWQVIALPAVFAIRFDFSGEPTSWWNKWSAQGMSVLLAAVIVVPAMLTSRLVLRAPHLISAPNSHWWLATPRRMRRFERLLREDLLLLAAVCLLLLAIGEAGITIAATSQAGGMPTLILVAMLVPLAGLIAVVVRMLDGGGRYDSQPELEQG